MFWRALGALQTITSKGSTLLHESEAVGSAGCRATWGLGGPARFMTKPELSSQPKGLGVHMRGLSAASRAGDINGAFT